MTIFKHFQHLILTSDQKRALEMLVDFLDGEKQIFILKGYAGTGKTTIIKGLVDYIHELKRQVSVMAPTGRAAKVLRDKTGVGITIHRGIYSFTELQIQKNQNPDDDNDVDFHYFFPIISNNNNDMIVIVDEASMVSDKITNHELFTFGTGRVLSDLLTFMQFPSKRNKLVLVGDPAQLPPVTDSDSLALTEDFFQALGLAVSSYELKEVVRQKSESLILQNAMKIRNLLSMEKRIEWQFSVDGKEVITTKIEDVANIYVQENPIPKVGNSVVISFSNNQCLSYNRSIRDQYFPGIKRLVPGDIVMIVNNNYHSYETELYNGDLAQVVYVSDSLESQSAPVWIKQGGKRKRVTITLHFRDIVIRLPHFGNDVHCKFIEDVLDSPYRDLSIDELKALFINFRIRFSQNTIERKAQGLPEITADSEDYKSLLRKDPYYNAIRIKYGYAITCHKAQGGEWETAFVNFSGMVGIKDSHLRWGYTAITRAKSRLRVVNAPDIGIFSSLKFNGISQLGKIPAEAVQYGFIPETPFHDLSSHPAKRAKYYEIQGKLEDTDYRILTVESRPYLEIYYVAGSKSEFRCDGIHNQAGMFKPFVSSVTNEEAEHFIHLVNEVSIQEHDISYSPSSEPLRRLYSLIQMYCSEVGIQITNVIEHADKYHIYYFFKTSGNCAYLQFYFNSMGAFSYVNALSDIGDKDEKLAKLINRLQ